MDISVDLLQDVYSEVAELRQEVMSLRSSVTQLKILLLKSQGSIPTSNVGPQSTCKPQENPRLKFGFENSTPVQNIATPPLPRQVANTEPAKFKLFYASNVDASSPAGFTDSALSVSPNGKYFEIEQTSTSKAIIRLINNPSLLKSFISQLYQFENVGVCQEVNQTLRGEKEPTSIRVVETGELALQGRVWIIEKPIKFELI